MDTSRNMSGCFLSGAELVRRVSLCVDGLNAKLPMTGSVETLQRTAFNALQQSFLFNVVSECKIKCLISVCAQYDAFTEVFVVALQCDCQRQEWRGALLPVESCSLQRS